MPATNRSLTRFEKALALTGQYSAFNIVTWVDIEGEVSGEKLRKGLETLAAPGSALRLTLSRNLKRFVLVEEFELPFEVADTDSEDAVEQALNHQVLPGEVLWKATFFPGEGKSGLLLRFHHVLIDGEAKLTLIRDLLAFVGEGKTLQPREMAHLKQKSRFREIVRSMRRGLQQQRYYQRHATHSILAPPPTKCHTIDFALDGAATQSLLKMVRKQRITLNSLLQAALGQAVAHHHSGATILQGMCFASHRRKLQQRPQPHELGAGITLIPYLADTRQELWSLAQTIQSQIRETLSEGGYFALNWMAPMVIAQGLKSKKHMGDVALSFSGVIPSQGDFGMLKLAGLRSYISAHHKAPRFSGWGQVQPDRELKFCFCYHSMSESEAAAIGRSFLDSLAVG